MPDAMHASRRLRLCEVALGEPDKRTSAHMIDPQALGTANSNSLFPPLPYCFGQRVTMRNTWGKSYAGSVEIGR